MKQSAFTIFLDFDGVLTPFADGSQPQPFQCLPAFEAALRPVLGHVEIVISSDWRHRLSPENLRAKFSTDIRSIIVDTTGVERWRRELEIEEWLDANPRANWLAIDDLEDHFEHFKERLLLIDRMKGFQESDGERLEHLVRSLMIPSLTPTSCENEEADESSIILPSSEP